MSRFQVSTDSTTESNGILMRLSVNGSDVSAWKASFGVTSGFGARSERACGRTSVGDANARPREQSAALATSCDAEDAQETQMLAAAPLPRSAHQEAAHTATDDAGLYETTVRRSIFAMCRVVSRKDFCRQKNVNRRMMFRRAIVYINDDVVFRAK